MGKGIGVKLHTVVVEGLYDHYKNGKRYEVIEVGTHTETQENLVVYHCIDDVGDYGSRKVWIRPKAMFEEGVELDYGSVVPRFKLVE